MADRNKTTPEGKRHPIFSLYDHRTDTPVVTIYSFDNGALSVAHHADDDELDLLIDPAPEHRNRLAAKPIGQILDPTTSAVIGWLYKWNNGDYTPRWSDGRD